MKAKTPSTVPDLFNRTRADWLDDCRVTARKLLQKELCITVEDVLKICPRPRYLRPNITGSIFKHDDFMPIGYTLSRKPSSHSRVIRKWTLR